MEKQIRSKLLPANSTYLLLTYFVHFRSSSQGLVLINREELCEEVLHTVFTIFSSHGVDSSLSAPGRVCGTFSSYIMLHRALDGINLAFEK